MFYRCQLREGFISTRGVIACRCVHTVRGHGEECVIGIVGNNKVFPS